ncbi:MAG: tetratricopeptide repeat protein [Litorimonas sp.]
MVDFINEVEEELRKDDYNRLLKKYGPIIGVVLFLIVAGTGFIEYRKYADDKKAQAVSAVYTAADKQLDEGRTDEAVAAFADLGETGPEGYAGLSLMRAAAIRQNQGDVLGAVRYFDQAAEKFSTARHKQLAQLKAAYLLADQGAYSDVIGRTTTLAETEAPYEFLARELLGFAYAESGDESSAREQFAYLTSIPGVPASVKQRAEQSMALMGTKKALAAPQPITEPASETQEDATDEE